jgi:glycyl-tRNA synthetase beta subunit
MLWGLNARTVSYAIVALIIVVLGWQLRSALKRNGELEVKLDQQAQEAREAADANESNQETIGALAARIAVMVAERAADAEERERVLAERERELLRARARADELEREREDEKNQNQDCAALTALDVASFCPTTAEQLRVRSRGPGGDQDGDGG